MRLKANNHKYIESYYHESIDTYSFLLEAGQGKNINGNMYAFLHELRSCEKWNAFSVYMVVDDNTIEPAKARIAFYGYQNVQFVLRNTDEYKYLLATCKYLITDNSFPPYYMKRKDQVVLNTWHGTPLKTLGRCDIENSSSIANVQKNYIMSDYVLFPNTYTRDIFMEDYCLKNIMTNEVVLADYPRNVAFFNEALKNKIKDQYDLQGKEIFAYLPTWRGSSRHANVQKQKEIILDYLNQIDNQLTNQQILYVNLHFLIGNQIDLSQMKHIRIFPSEYETYDFLNVCDVLITDYSSVFFDYAVSQKKIVLFTYDLDEYMSERGMYFSIEELPFPRVDNVDDLMKELNQKDYTSYESFLKQFCLYASPDTVKRLLDLLVNNQRDEIIVEKPTDNGLKNVLIHVDAIKTKHQEEIILDYILNLPKEKDKNYIVLFHGKVNEIVVDFIQHIPNDIQVLGYVVKNSFILSEKIVLGLGVRSSIMNTFFDKKIDKALKREAQRRFGNIRINEIIDLFDRSYYIGRELSLLHGMKKSIILNAVYTGVMNARKPMLSSIMYRKKHGHQFEKYENIVVNEDTKDTFYNLCVSFVKLFSHAKQKEKHVTYSLYFLCQRVIPLDTHKMSIYLGDKEVKSHFSNQGIHLFKNFYFYKTKIEIPNDNILSLPIQNKFLFVYQDEQGRGLKKGIQYKFIRLRKTYKSSKIFQINEDTCCYFRQSKANTLFFSVRPYNKTDGFIQNMKMNCAYYVAKIFKGKKIYLLFEKDSARYEESASVVYEKMIDDGYKQAYFILDRDYHGYDKIEERYRHHIIYKYSWKHYLYFFRCQTFLGSEALVHAIELRVSNKHALKKINSKDVDYVFLQHGVMYMISLDSESRSFFKPRSIKENGRYRVVTSSLKEADHFISLGNYDASQVIVCGLPKFDRNQWNEDATKIVIMPTWRPWEYNEATTDFKQTHYYQMIERIFYAIDEKLRDQIIILPHPLFFAAAMKDEFELKKHMLFDVKYDDILKDTKVLITDYSSIAYDAFYRGCNVMFYWEELNDCLEYYGPSTKLMLNGDNVFGDICYNSQDVTMKIKDNYSCPQQKVYLDHYQEIVTFHDGNNAERLIQHLKNENII